VIRTMPHDPEINASKYVSGELSRRMRRWFEAHLLECDDCWREVWVARLGRRVAEHAREAAPARLRENVRAMVHLSSAEMKPTGWWRRLRSRLRHPW
jgi:anti-sigma factor RsiW